jgi:hypothetical protein
VARPIKTGNRIAGLGERLPFIENFARYRRPSAHPRCRLRVKLRPSGGGAAFGAKRRADCGRPALFDREADVATKRGRDLLPGYGVRLEKHLCAESALYFFAPFGKPLKLQRMRPPFERTTRKPAALRCKGTGAVSAPLAFDWAYLDRHAAFCNLIPGRSPARCASRTSMLRLNRLIFPFLISDTRA